MLRLDHLVVVAADLATGTAAVEAALGVALAPGGQHPHMGTHNRLLNLGDAYLEVIAPDPAAPLPLHPRWFAMDGFAGPPRLTHWVCATDDMAAALEGAPAGIGTPVALSRGAYRWRFAIPASGQQPFDGACPALIAWDGPDHPARALPDAGVRLTALHITHPQADRLSQWLAQHFDDSRVTVEEGPEMTMAARFDTPLGPRRLRA